jgi:thioesterase domain-containing protein/acyl carrier protein
MPASLARRLYASSSITRLLFIYGPTEATVQVITAEVGPDAVDPVLIGRPIPGVGVHVTDAELSEVPDGDFGELCLSGIQLADGYIGRDDLTAERFVPAPPAMGGRLYRTGDLGRRLADGTFEFRGRMDDQVKIRGQRVEPGEVQAHLAGHPAVSQAHVGFREGVGGTELVAWAAPLGESVDPEELRDYLRHRLPAPLVPSVITVLDTLPVGPRGKLDVARLPSPDAQTLAGAGSDGELLRAYDRTVPPSMTDRDALVEVVSAAVAEVLGTATPVWPDDDFFDDLGGTSLLAVRLVARLEEVLSVRVPLSLVLGGTTIAHLADALVGLQGEPVQLVVNGRGDDVPLVLVHAWIGGVLRYRLLAPYLPPSQPLIGIAVNHDVQGSQPHTIDALAEQALVQLRALRPTGPYLLGGHSAGGLIALEMARRLRVEGAEVGEVLLIDTPALVSGWRFWRSEIVLNWDDWKTRSWSERVERVQSFISNRRGRIGTPSGDDQDVQWRLAVTNRSSMRAIRTFEPAPYDGDVLVLYTSDSKRRHRGRSDLGWGELVRGTLTAEPIGGTHDTIFAPANAPGISAHLLGAARRLRREVSA